MNRAFGLLLLCASVVIANELSVASEFDHATLLNSRRSLRACGTDGIVVPTCPGGARDVSIALCPSHVPNEPVLINPPFMQHAGHLYP